MAEYSIDLRRSRKEIHPLDLIEQGSSPTGDQLSFTNYYLERNGAPFFAVCGEFHFSRYPAEEWEDELIKMKLGGVNVVATYIFWIHHEEEQGHFRWDGNRDLRRFIELCGKHGLYAIARVGPFAHGECRNGGMPDWLYGMPCVLRSNDPQYLELVRRLYGEIGQQLQGLFFQQGGPIIAVQLENEFMHAGAPWEVVARQAREWVSSGEGGTEHMRLLKQIAQETGLIAPFYTSTGWHGSPVLEGEVLPLYGGYAFCPWNVDEQRPVHAPTIEYLFRSYHDNTLRWNQGEPPYPPETYPFACCEMGGGMQSWYQHRFIVPAISVEAMTLMKLAGGCNFIGYYMYHGGLNPVGQYSYMNEHVTPKISYDFQAPLGEFGQVRDSYRATRLQHLFMHDFAEELCPTATVLPASNTAITPQDSSTLRFAARVADGSGFLFLNNYQDHVETQDLPDLRITLQFEDETITLPRQPLTLPRDVCAILPLRLELQGVRLNYATTQLVTKLEVDGETFYVFFAPDGFPAEYAFASQSFAELEVTQGTLVEESGTSYVTVTPGTASLIRLRNHQGERLSILTLSRAEALQLSKLTLWGRERLVLSNADLLLKYEVLELHGNNQLALDLGLFPAPECALHGPEGPLNGTPDGLFSRYQISLPPKPIELAIQPVTGSKVVVRLPENLLEGVRDVLLSIRYQGDVGSAFINGRLIHDNFANGAPWELKLSSFLPEALEHGLVINISPLRQGKIVFNDSAMAVQHALLGQEIAQIDAIEALPQYVASIRCVAD